MTSLNTYIDAIKPFAKSLQEKATKFTDAVDDKLKKTQENLEKKRSKVIEASESEALPRLWRPSSEHPLGEFVAISTPPATPVSSRASADGPPSQTVRRKKYRRQERLNELESENERRQEVRTCLNDMINEIIEKETMEKCLNRSVDMVSSMEESAEMTLMNTLTIEENSIESINTNEENSESDEGQENAIETDFTQSITRLEISLEKSEICEVHFSAQLSEEPPENPPIDPPPNNTDQSESIHLTSIDSREESFLNSLPLSSNVIDTSIAQLPPTPVKRDKRFSLCHSYSLPSNIIASHMSCSATHIYICTDQSALYYTQVPEHSVYHSLNWYRYTLPADRVIVSESNQTVWRIFQKCIYSSSDTIRLSPLGINWTELTFHQGEDLLSVSLNDQFGWFIKDDGTLWLIRLNDENQELINVPCPFHLNHVVCSVDKIGVTTSDGQILVRVGCTNDCPEGDGWIFVEHSFGLFDDFSLIAKDNIICIIDKKHRVWISDWSVGGKFYEVLRNDDYNLKWTESRYFLGANEKFLCFTDCHEQLFIFSNCLTAIHWSLVQKGTRLQRLIGAFPNENHVWALTTDGTICSSAGQVLAKPRQAQYLTNASFVPQTNSESMLWALDESCNIYTRNDLEEDTQWEQLDQSQFDWNRRLVDIVCNSVGVWAVDDQGYIHFRHGHSSNSNDNSLLNPAWIPIPGEAIYHRSFAQIFCGPKNWMVYATDNKQTVYARVGIDETNHIGTSWTVLEDCSALGLAISEHALWLLTSHGRIQCRENISLTNPTGKRTTISPGRFNSMTVSTDDEQIWALYPPHHLFKLDRITVLFEK